MRKRRNDGIRKLPFGHHHSNNCFKQDSSRKAKINGQKGGGETGYLYNLKVSPNKMLTEKINLVSIQQEKPGRYRFIQVIRGDTIINGTKRHHVLNMKH